MAGIVFDTNIWISHKPTSLPRSLQMSVVVLQELIAGAPDPTVVKKYEAAWKRYEQEGKLLVPTAEDWVIAGRVLNALLRGLKSKNNGKTPRLSDQEKQRIVRDVLIARCVKRSGATLVTDNLKDFKAIHRFCSLKIKSGREFFSSTGGRRGH
ncbi:MAG: type II toxin-antitoxin system VapC family toxin [Blastocatellia bacterium]